MFLGHYATALVPYEKTRKTHAAPFWLFLLAAQFLDFLMIIAVPLGFESLEPALFQESSFRTMRTDMLYTHDLVPVVGWTIAFGVGALAMTRNKVVALWCVGLVLFHELCDLIVGFQHNVFGHDTASVGFNLYNNAPVWGLWIEILFCGAIVWWFVRRRATAGTPVSARLKWGLYLVLVGGTAATLPMANQSLVALFGS